MAIKVTMPTTATGSLIKNMKGGDAFVFTSTKSAKNSGLFIRLASSKEVKGIQLETGKSFKFSATERGNPVNATVQIS